MEALLTLQRETAFNKRFNLSSYLHYQNVYPFNETTIKDSDIFSLRELLSDKASEIFNPKISITFTNTLGFINEIPFNYLGTYLDKPVLSILSPEIYQRMNYIHLLNDYSFLKTVNQAKQIFDKTNSRRTSYNASLYQYSIPSPTNDINFSLSDLITNFVLSNDTPLDITYQSNINVLATKSTCTGTNFELSIKSISTNNYLKPNGNFLPVYVPAKVYYPVENKIIDCYIFTFMFNLPIEKVVKYKKAREYLFSFIKDIYCYFGSKFYNSTLPSYMKSKELTSYNELTYHQYILAKKASNLNKIKEHVKYNSLYSPSTFFRQFELPLNFKKKKEKIINKYEANVNFLNSFESTISLDETLKNYSAVKRSYNHAKKYLEDAVKSFEEAKNSLEKSKHNLKSVFDNFEYNLKINKPIKNSYNKLLEKQQELFKTLPGKENLTYENLFKDIDLISFSYCKKDDENSTIENWTKVDFSSQEKFSTLTLDQLFFSENSIMEVVFATKNPVKITLVSDQNKSVVGGPYIVKCRAGSLKIRLKDYKSFYGFKDNTHSFSYYVHPHASSSSLLSVDYRNACLGEASSLLYSAFKKNDISLIILSAMLWVRSTNSSDAWGKNYVYFQPYEEYLEESNSSGDFEINQDLEDFISTNISLFDPSESNKEVNFVEPPEVIEETLPLNVSSSDENQEEQVIDLNQNRNRYERYLALTST